MAMLIAGTILTSMFLPQDLPHMAAALEWRSEQRVIGMDLHWQPPPSHPLNMVTAETPHQHTVRSTPAPSTVSPGVEQWRSLVEEYFKPEDAPWAMAVMWCESQGDPNAKNPASSASGLFQHLASYWGERSAAAGWAGASIWDPEANVAVAAWLLAHGGRSHWTCTKKVTW